MVRSALSKVAWVGRTASMVFGLALVMALMFGLASAAFGANGGNFILGQPNVATTITKLAGAAGVNGPMLQLINNNAGTNDTALDLRVQAGEAPMRVNSTRKVANLNADKLDNKDSTQIGVNGWQQVSAISANNSITPKLAQASCPSGKVLVGTGFDIDGGKSAGGSQTDVVVDSVVPSSSATVVVLAYEEEATTANWTITAHAICAKAP